MTCTVLYIEKHILYNAELSVNISCAGLIEESSTGCTIISNSSTPFGRRHQSICSGQQHPTLLSEFRGFVKSWHSSLSLPFSFKRCLRFSCVLSFSYIAQTASCENSPSVVFGWYYFIRWRNSASISPRFNRNSEKIYCFFLKFPLP